MKVTLKDGYIENYALIGGLIDGIEVDDSSIENMEYFMENSSAYHIVDGKIELDSEKLKEIKNDIENKMLRKQREEECFPYINRGVFDAVVFGFVGSAKLFFVEGLKNEGIILEKFYICHLRVDAVGIIKGNALC